MEPVPQGFIPDPAAYQGMMQAMSQQTGWNGFSSSMWDKARAAMKSEWDTAKAMVMNPIAALGGFGNAFASGMASDSLQGMMAQGIDMLTFNYFDLTSVTPMYGHQQAHRQGQWIGWATVTAEELAITYGAAAAIHAGRTAHWGLKLSVPWIMECGYVLPSGLIVSGSAMVWVHAGTVSGAALAQMGLVAGICTVAMSNGSAGLPDSASQATPPTYESGLEQARKSYPKLAGKMHDHHITPKYLGGPANGPIANIDAAYHQLITNAFRALQPYGTGRIPTPQELAEIMKSVYFLFPLP
jgi:hypothetical protein